MSIIYTIITIVLGLVGFYIANKIISLKKKPEPITCPMGQSCDDVIRGKYSTFLGIPTVNVGRIFYLVITSFFLLGSFVPMSREALFIVLLVSGVALLFSVYLIAVQLLVIKKWCSWCLFSALINLLLFVVVFTGFSTLFLDFLFDYRALLGWLFVFATTVGALVSTLHAGVFIRFLKDFKISKKEYYRLTMYSQTAWVAIALCFLSGLGLVLTDTYGDITADSEFLVMGVIIGILVIYELVQNMIVVPRLIDLHFGDHPKLDDEEHSYQRKLAFAFVNVGVASWYLLMLFTNFSWHEYQPMFLVWLHGGVVIIAVSLGLLFERIIYRKSLREK